MLKCSIILYELECLNQLDRMRVSTEFEVPFRNFSTKAILSDLDSF